jgi:hypothetical protein
MGAFAAGAGSYNIQTAAARSMNAQTAMQMNDYMYGVVQRNTSNYLKRVQDEQKKTNEASDAISNRIRNNPEPRDIHTGDALNIVLTDLLNPKVFTQAVQKATTPVDSQLVKNIVFQHAANMVLISLDDVSARGVPDYLATSPDFAVDRQTIRGIVAKARKEAESSNQVSPDTLRSFRTAVKAAQDKVDTTLPQGSPRRDEADNFLKALYGLSKMVERPNIEAFLKGLDRYPTTTLGQLITFMHSFNLRFGVAKTPEQESAYDQLYPMLVALRDQAYAGGPTNVAQGPPPNPKAVTSFFSGMDYSHFQPQADPHTGKVPPPPPPPGQPK